MGQVLVATDGSDGGQRALEFAAKLAKDTGRGLLIVNVSNDLSDEDLRTLAQTEAGLLEELDQYTNQVLDQSRRQAQRLGITEVQTYVAWGQPAAGIIEAAQKHAADLIVIGRRGRGQLAGLLLGSVSQKLAGLSPCPVTIVP
jgi:nucleotide-binding universal stress UspA family protein